MTCYGGQVAECTAISAHSTAEVGFVRQPVEGVGGGNPATMPHYNASTMVPLPPSTMLLPLVSHNRSFFDFQLLFQAQPTHNETTGT